MSQPPGPVPLAEMIQSLRSELERSVLASKDAAIRFKVRSIDLEIKVAVTRSAEAGAGVKFWVVNADGKSTSTQHEVQIVRLSLEPVGASGHTPGGEVLVSQPSTELPD